MRERKARLVVNKSGGTGKGSTFRATLPTAWIREMNLGEESRNIKLEFDGKIIKIKKERLRMLRLVEKDHGEKTVLFEGTFKEILEYLKDNENLMDWVHDEDPEMELPNLDVVEDLRDLKYELKKIDLSWWELVIEEDGKIMKLEFGTIENLSITPGEGHILITGIIPGGSVDTEFETRLYPDGETETRHCGIGPDFIWTNWQEGHLRGE